MGNWACNKNLEEYQQLRNASLQDKFYMGWATFQPLLTQQKLTH